MCVCVCEIVCGDLVYVRYKPFNMVVLKNIYVIKVLSTIFTIILIFYETETLLSSSFLSAINQLLVITAFVECVIDLPGCDNTTLVLSKSIHHGYILGTVKLKVVNII